MILEVCIDSVESALAAQEGGAARVELCAALDHGGTTPSESMIKSVRERVSIALAVMIRPRPGDFCYSDQEFELMMRDVERVKALGTDGLVFGILTVDGDVDVPRSRILVERARPCFVTFHRAFDESRNLEQAINDLKSIGIDRLLSSGGKGDISKNAVVIAELVRLASGSFKVMAGGGVTFENVSELVRISRVDEIHVLSAVSRTRAPDPQIPGLQASPTRVVDVGQVRRMGQLLREASSDSQK